MKNILHVQSNEDLGIARKSNEFDKIVLDRATDNLKRHEARLMIRESIYLAKEVEIITNMKKEHVFAAIMAASNPIKDIKWLEVRDLCIVNVTRQFP